MENGTEEGEGCLTAPYRLPEDCLILDEIADAVWFATYNPNKVEFLWCNKASVKLWNKKDLQDFLKTDIFNGRSAAVKKLHDELYQNVQVDCEFNPIRVIRNGHEETVACVRAKCVSFEDKGQMEVNRSHEMLRHTPTCTLLFTTAGEHIQSNVSARTYYYGSETKDGCHVKGREVTIRDVLETCVWPDEDEEGLDISERIERFLQRVMKLRIGDSQLLLETQKHPYRDDQGNPIGQDQDSIWHSVQFIPTIDPATALPSILVIESDISQLEQMKRAEQELQASQRQQEQFFAAVSHELRTPLNGIIGLSESLLEDEDCHPSIVKTLEIILSSGHRLNSLVNDILDAASLKQGVLHVKQTSVCITDVAENVCNSLSKLSQPGVSLSNEVTKNIPAVTGDPQRIAQILTNLLGNALKFTHKGTVVVSAHSMPDENMVAVVVRDTGIGISEDKVASVFQAFNQGDMSATRMYEGTGLGLTLVKHLVEAHGGTVWVESELGVGTAVTFTLPFWVPEQHTGPADAKRASEGIEDDDEQVSSSQSRSTPRYEIGSSRGSSGSSSGKFTTTKIDFGLPSKQGGVAGSSMMELRKQNLKLQADVDQLVRELGRVRSHAFHPGALDATKEADEVAADSQSSRMDNDEGKKLVESSCCSHKDDKASVDWRITALEEELQQKDMTIAELRAAIDKITKDGDKATKTADLGLPAHKDVFGKIEIMCVDDNPTNQAVVEKILTPLGHVVTLCSDGVEALEQLQSRRYLPDLILLDAMMPKVSGIEVAQRIRYMFPHVAVPIIMVSAKSREEHIVEGLEVGCNDYVTKPFKAKELIARIDSQLKHTSGWRNELQAASKASLVKQLLPESVIERIARGTMTVDRFQQVSVLVCDVADFSHYAKNMRMDSFVNYMKRLHSAFDDAVQAAGAFRVDIAGEAYIVVAGHEDKGQNSAEVLAGVAESLIAAAATVPVLSGKSAEFLSVRIGICTNSAHASVVGSRTPRYVFFGKAVMAATWLEMESPADCVHVCNRTLSILPAQSLYKDSVPFSSKQSKEATHLLKIGKWQNAKSVTVSQQDQQLTATELTSTRRTSVSSEDSGTSSSRLDDSPDTSSYWRTMNLIQRAQSLSQGVIELLHRNEQTLPKQGTDEQLEQLQTELKNTVKTKNEILAELEQCSTDLQEKQKELEACQEELTLVRSYAETSMSDLTKALQGSVNELKKELKECSTKREHLQREVIELKSKNDALEAEKGKVSGQTCIGAIVRRHMPSDHDSSPSEEERRRSLTGGSSSGSLSTMRPPARTAASVCHDDASPQMLSHQELFGTIEIFSVDDTPMNHMVIERILKRTGYKMTSCMDGVQALKLIDERGYLPDMMLLDVMMPHMSGHEVCMKLRELYPTTSLPVIMISAKSNEENILEGFQSGCIDYVTKPFSRNELLARINAQLKNKEIWREKIEIVRKHSPPGGILPEHVKRTTSGSRTNTMVDMVPAATVMFADVVNYELLSASMSAEQLFITLNELFTELEIASERHKLVRSEHAGDYLMLVATPENHKGEMAHAQACLDAAIEMMDITRKIRARIPEARRLALAIGISSGNIYSCASVRGEKGEVMPPKVFFGETVNAAYQLEVTGRGMTIIVGNVTRELLKGSYSFHVMGKDKTGADTYILENPVCEWESALKQHEQTANNKDDPSTAGSRRCSITAGNASPTLSPLPAKLQDVQSEESDSQMPEASGVLVRRSKRRGSISIGGRSPVRGAGGRHRRMMELQLRQETEKCGNLSVKVLRLEGELAELRDNCDELRVKLEESALELGQARQSMAMLTLTEGDLKKKAAAAAQAEAAALERSKEALATLERLRVRCAELEAEKKELDDRLKAEAMPAGVGAHASGTRYASHQDDTIFSGGNRQMLSMNFDGGVLGAQSEIGTLRTVRAELEGHVRFLQGSNEELRADRSRLIARVDELEKENCSLREKLVTHRLASTSQEATYSPQRPSSLHLSMSPADRNEILEELRADMRMMLFKSGPSAAHSAAATHMSPAHTSKTFASESASWVPPSRGASFGGERGGRLVIRDGASALSGHVDLEKLHNLVTITDIGTDGDSARRTLTEVVRRFGILSQPLKIVRGGGGKLTALAEMETGDQALRLVHGLDGAEYNGQILHARLALWEGTGISFNNSSDDESLVRHFVMSNG